MMAEAPPGEHKVAHGSMQFKVLCSGSRGRRLNGISVCVLHQCFEIIHKQKNYFEMVRGTLQVDNHFLEGFNNHQAVEVLRNTGQVVRLKLARYNHGAKFLQLQQYASESKSQNMASKKQVFH